MTAWPLTHTEPKHIWPQTLSEVFLRGTASATGLRFALSGLQDAARPVLIVQDRLSRLEMGIPYGAGLRHGARLLHVAVSRPVDVLMAMEDGLRTKGLAAVIGEVWGVPAALDFTATKRLVLRAEAAGVPCWLLRQSAQPELSAARNRWWMQALPSHPHPFDPQAPGAPQWQLDLFRSRLMRPTQWVARYDRSTDRLCLSAPSADRSVAAAHDPARQRRTG